MRKLILLAAMTVTALPSAAMAQQADWRHDRTDVRHDRRDVRQDRRELRRDQREVRRDRARYVAPYRNWNYRAVSVGYRLQPAFYGSRYYINDYRTYHVRAPGRWQRWIRYGDDLLLVNVRSGRVLDVVHYRYW